MKIPDCNRCQFYSHQLYFVCAIHPDGVEDDSCLDFRPDQNLQEEESWAPDGYFWYGGELIPERLSRKTREEQLQILDTHPFFTGVCPQCAEVFSTSPTHGVKWQCDRCGWLEA
ncbi:MAG: hypothetical protein N5P05_004222 (plasmid) [Chroococcopsis gigantea SAG 12.99]|jgi:hypothetical protein|nr:hypothetical protein [Chroococcopsis gigantea SAG 12.99]